MMFFYFLKIIFDISTSKRSKKYKPHSILTKKKKFKFARNAGTNAIPNVPLIDPTATTHTSAKTHRLPIHNLEHLQTHRAT